MVAPPCVTKAAAWSLTLVAGVVFAAFALAFAFWWSRRMALRRRHRLVVQKHPRLHHLKPPPAYHVSQLAVALGAMSIGLSAAAAVAWWQYGHGHACASPHHLKSASAR